MRLNCILHHAVKRDQQGYRTGNFITASELAYIPLTCLTANLQNKIKNRNVKVFDMLLGSGMMILIKVLQFSVAMAMEKWVASSELQGVGE